MPKTKTTKKTKTLQQSYSSQVLLRAALAILVAISVTMFVIALHSEPEPPKPPRKAPPIVSIGPLGYRIEDGRAIKRSDPVVQELHAFLTSKAAHEGCPAGTSAYEYVQAVTKDETQVLLKYGCGAADSPMYIRKQNSSWKSVSPTNQFNELGIPVCDYLDRNAISKEIAPVCVSTIGATQSNAAPEYSVR